MEKSKDAIEVYGNAGELAWAAALRFAGLCQSSIAERGKFCVALSGGSTPKLLFSLLADQPFADSLAWSSIYFFWGDERCVAPDHADSNYHMASNTLLSKVPVPAQNIFRIPAEDENPDQAAANYSRAVQEFFNAGPARFDLVFLGMGADGHTASLFPGTKALNIDDQIAAANYVDKFQAHRITLTAQTINNARNIIFLVAGEDKAVTLKEVIEGEYQPNIFPSQLIKPHDGYLLWMIDEAAASLLI